MALQPTKSITDMCIPLCLPMNANIVKLMWMMYIDIDKNGPLEHLWSQIAPSTEESRSQSVAEGSDSLTEVLFNININS